MRHRAVAVIIAAARNESLGRFGQTPPTEARNRAMRFFNTACPVNPADH